MHIFFGTPQGKDRFLIQGEEFQHFKARRIRKGEPIGIIWGGNVYLCEPESIGKIEAVCLVKGRLGSKKPSVSVTLYQAVPVELKTFDLIIQKSTELGVMKVVPLITGRSFRNRHVLMKRMHRWTRIYREAMKQSGRAYELDISEPMEVGSLEPEHELNILLDNFYEGEPLGAMNLKGVRDVGLVVGPEGGFSEEESEALRDKGFISVKLEPHTLRTETAAIVGVGIIVNLAGS
ncbi:RsmE family RNA methyltransferase [Hydrogenivirga sp.]